ncbi:MAG: TolB-like 6-bladed beta-propeller domain-containing protein [Prevotellaceae bacterium]|nr:TolB-like 6-bladed beta-propeller domain-containing protein [Prevotellaceae bacterium]
MKSILIVGVLVLLYSCADTPGSTKTLDQYRDYSAALQGKTLLNDSIIWSVGLIAYYGDTLIVRCYQCENKFAVYTVRGDSLRYIGECLTEGQGPFEVIGAVYGYFRDERTKTPYVYNVTHGNTRLFQVPNLLNQETWRPLKCPQISLSYWRSFAPHDEHTFIASSGYIDKENWLAAIDLDKQEVIPLPIYYPEDGVENVASITKTMVYSSNILKQPGSKGRYLHYCYNFGNYAEIVEIGEGLEIKQRRLLLDVLPKYRVLPNKDFSLIKNCLNGVKAFVTAAYIYIMPYDGISKHSRGMNNEVFVFDWEGNFIKSYRLDTSIYTFFAVDERDTQLVGVTVDPTVSGEYRVVAFPLDK